MNDYCYRHPSHKAGVTCQRCDKPICPSCMVSASVGFQCPECAGIKREGSLMPAGSSGSLSPARSSARSTRSARPWSKQPYRLPRTHDYSAQNIRQTFTPFAYLVLLVNLVVFGISVSQWGTIFRPSRGLIEIQQNYGLMELFLDTSIPGVRALDFPEWWRIFTSAFIHAGAFHIIFNMLMFWVLGRILETTFGTPKFILLYMGSVVGGSMGAILLQSGNTVTVGASGGVFGLMGAFVVFTKFAGGRILNSPIALLLVLNLVFSFASTNISLGGHLGGLIAGLLISLCFTYAAREIATKTTQAATGANLASVFSYGSAIIIGGLAFWGCIVFAEFEPARLIPG